MVKRDLALDLFRAYKTGIIKKNRSRPERRSERTDPTLISDVLEELINDREWQSGIAEGNLFSNWNSVVGEEVAEHTEPISLLDGVLLVKCSSTAWATQLTMMEQKLLTTIQYVLYHGLKSIFFTIFHIILKHPFFKFSYIID